MAAPADGPPIVRLPERFDRRLRLGPFPSGRDALKFVGYAGAAALLVPFTSAVAWLAIAGTAFVVAVVRVDGQGLDDRAFAFVRWRLRGVATWRTVVTPTGALARRGIVAVAPGRYVAALRAAGSPTAYLPPADLAERFDRYRELLRAVDGSLGVTVGSRAMRAAPVLPAPTEPGPTADGAAADGYRSLVDLLCRRRHVRRIDLVLGTARFGADGIADLEVRISGLLDGLATLGIRAARLRDRALEDAVRAGGWSCAPLGH